MNQFETRLAQFKDPLGLQTAILLNGLNDPQGTLNLLAR
jgi:hypothetical protein